MSKNKYYFSEIEDTDCYPLDYHKEYMRDNCINIMEVFEAVREKDSGCFFCKQNSECYEVGSCGKFCDYYSPRNKKSGICKHYGFCYEKGKSKIIKL